MVDRGLRRDRPGRPSRCLAVRRRCRIRHRRRPGQAPRADHDARLVGHARRSDDHRCGLCPDRSRLAPGGPLSPCASGRRWSTHGAERLDAGAGPNRVLAHERHQPGPGHALCLAGTGDPRAPADPRCAAASVRRERRGGTGRPPVVVRRHADGPSGRGLLVQLSASSADDRSGDHPTDDRPWPRGERVEAASSRGLERWRSRRRVTPGSPWPAWNGPAPAGRRGRAAGGWRSG